MIILTTQHKKRPRKFKNCRKGIFFPPSFETALYCNSIHVLSNTVLFCNILDSTLLHCAVLYSTALCCTVDYCTVLYCPVQEGRGGARVQRCLCPPGRTGLGCSLETTVQVAAGVLYCTLLYSTALLCTILYSTVLYCTLMYFIVLYCTVFYCDILYCILLYLIALYCTLFS